MNNRFEKIIARWMSTLYVEYSKLYCLVPIPTPSLAWCPSLHEDLSRSPSSMWLLICFTVLNLPTATESAGHYSIWHKNVRDEAKTNDLFCLLSAEVKGVCHDIIQVSFKAGASCVSLWCWNDRLAPPHSWFEWMSYTACSLLIKIPDRHYICDDHGIICVLHSK